MKLSYLIIGGFGFIIGWNIFLIQRDQKMMDAYYGPAQPSMEMLRSK